MKTTKITFTRVLEIYEECGANISSREAEDTARHCNENGAIFHCGLDAEGWARRWAEEEAHQQECEARDAAREDVHFD
ncbi:TPA: hypothetical protein L4592_005873 [Pseudomonas aeruginosa]|uniref:hypothetical protein n=1 Tax=Klebsiella aerogenes TaxID=548 RepID=UPI0007B3B90B|nr:hypothetical protein [Klebsiella aerogenes]ECC2538002.1 hypothetical protein [Salmonella enterica]EEY1775219.1 hypothetical protein [Escherichia coli]KZQ77622.1 hypothetical protein A3N52_15405 [Klebsiella aerogenes]HBO5663889.1 hypothetical protein [Pseudomonas aeruginosa]